jgi:heme oxygenase (biliverdin-IX-beta and delta-forming)
VAEREFTDHDVPTPATPAPPAAVPVVIGREPSDAERARTLAAAVTTGVLSTIGRNPAGTPFGSLAPFGLDAGARPVLCISELAEHTRNLGADGRASLLIARPVAAGADPLAAARLTLVGRAAPVPDHEVAAARAAHLEGNPHAAGYIDFGDFALWALEVESVRYVGGYGRMSWIDVDAWQSAEPDPVDAVADGAIDHLNADHADACLLMARHLGGRVEATTAEVTALDRYGLDLWVTGPDGSGRVRLGFDGPVTTPGAIRSATVELARRARSAAPAT